MGVGVGAKSRKPNSSGQAMVETIAMVPLIIALLMFMYQAYVLVHRAQVVQKYLKAATIGSILNRYDAAIGQKATEKSPYSGASGSFYFVYGEGVEYNLDMWTKGLLWFFARQDQQSRLESVFDAFSGKQTMGICVGGAGPLGIQVSPDVLDQREDTEWTCN
ncbi:MAG: hypothetical protein JXA66_01550 [Oligoflexia bacterium]|nr:hypothetical protein [Oligoflexia bacterium]